MLKQVLAVAVVGLFAAGSASAHDSNWSHRYAPPAYHYSPHYNSYSHRYAPIRYAPRYCPPPRWSWHRGYYDGYPRYFRDAQRGGYNYYDRNDGNDHGGRNDWDRHH